MQVCLVIEVQEGVSWQQWLAIADACESAGLHGLFSSDHYLSVIGYQDRGGLDALTTLGALATRTNRIRLGTLVSPVTFRHPSQLAKAVVTIDHLSGGRVELGIGAGWNAAEHRAYGFPFPETTERLELLAEQLEIVVRQWTVDDFSFDGKHYQLDSCTALPKPLQQPRPPIIVGGAARPKSLELAVRFADEYNCFLVTPSECAERRRRLDDICERGGRDPTSLPFSLMSTCLIGKDRRELLARTRTLMQRHRGATGDPGAFLQNRERWILGTVSEVIDRLHTFRKSGVERFYLHHPLHDDTEMVAQIGEEIVPVFAGI